MLRPTLLALALVFPLASFGCTPNVTTETTTETRLGSPLRWMPVEDSSAALAAVAAAADADPERTLGVDEFVVSVHGIQPEVREYVVIGPKKHVLKDFIDKHPDLAPPPGYRFGYQLETGSGGELRWRLHCLRDVGFEISQVESAEIVKDEWTDDPQLRVRLLGEDAAAFARLTTTHAGDRLALVRDDEILMAPIFMEPLTSGTFTITLGRSRSRAEAEAELARLLGR